MNVDLQDPRALIDAAYACISGPAGAPRDWATLRTLYLPRALLLRTVYDDAGEPQAKVFNVDEYIADTTPFFARESFHEVATGFAIQRFGAVASVRSTYEAKRDPRDTEVIKRGVNFLSLFHDGNRWWIASIVWDNEAEGRVLPREWSEAKGER